MSTTTFEALGTYVFLCPRQPAAVPRMRRLAAEILADVDRTCSRFREDSDLSRANRHAGTWVEVDPVLVAAVTTAREAARQTDGLVNPLLGRPLQQLGYDRDFGRLHEVEDEVVTPRTPPAVDAWQEIGLDPDGAIRIPAGTALDLGATGKAWAADLIAESVAGDLGIGANLSLGGDVAIGYDDGEPWPISFVTRPGDPPDVTVTLDRGGLATSTTRVRRWTRRGVQVHHLLDPRTGLSASTPWSTVTATGPTATAANTATTAAVVLGPEAPRWLADHGVSARLVAEDGTVRTTGSWPAEAALEREERRGA
jgi:thiamine biosynthesis lipoprotein